MDMTIQIKRRVRMSIKVSIIIPVYNVASYVIECLESVKKQSYRNLEVILVDDCGTDDSMIIAEAYLERYVFTEVKIVRHSHNRGLSAARNTGLKVATGEYVYFLDSDDEITDNCIAAMTEPIKKFHYDFVISNYEVIGSHKKYPPLDLPEGVVRNNKNILHTYAQGMWYMMAWNKLCSREFLLANNLFFEEGLLHEDVVWSFKLACKAQSMYVSKTSTYRYRIRTASITTDTSLEKDVNQYTKVFQVITRFVVEENRQYGADEYCILEGRKSSLLFSLLQKKEYSLYTKYYPVLYHIWHISPWKTYKFRNIGIRYLLRDLHYFLPMSWGREYKHFFYNLCYKWRGKHIEGALW